MEAQLVPSIPTGPRWQYEPKWDGFRCLIFRDHDNVKLQSKSGQPLARYFPELVQVVLRITAKRFVLDGEIVIPVQEQLSFDELLMRIHPAASRVQALAAEHPAMLIVFDLLVSDRGKQLSERPLYERREHLEKFAQRFLVDVDRIRLSPATTELSAAKRWFRTVGDNLDGIIAKRRDLPYQSGNRNGMQKIKRLRSADCVVGGFRYMEGTHVIGSLLLGLYDEEGLLHHVGFTSTFQAAERKMIAARLKPFIEKPGFTGRAPGGKSRWSTRRTDQWHPLRPHFVVEVQYDHFSGGRFRHGTKFLRWRPDIAPHQAKLDQVLRCRSATLRLPRPIRARCRGKATRAVTT
jgi:ATP-dependent DNA ligase